MKRILSAAGVAFVLLVGAPAGAAFDGIRLTLLGGVPASPQSETGGPGVLVEAGEEVLLFDCGVGTLERLQRTGIRLGDLSAVFLTSLDPAHVAGCSELLTARAQIGSEGPLLLWGPGGTVQAVEEWTGGPKGNPPAAVYAFEVGENVVYDTDDVTVTAIVADYPGQRQAYGYRIDRDRRAAAVLAGARYSENLAHGMRDVQVLVDDVAATDVGQPPSSSIEQAALPGDASPEEAGRLLSGARPYLAVYAHLRLAGVSEEEVVRRTRRYYRGPLQIGRALMVIEIQNEVQVRSAPSQGTR
jgi:hypothetical protein